MEAAVTKFKQKHVNQSAVQIHFEDIKKLLINPEDRVYKKRFTAKVGQHLKIFNVQDIECFYAENKGTYLHTNENRNYLIDSTLEELEKELNPDNFFRINRKFYVNINALKDIISYTNSRLQLKLNTYKESEVIVARERVKNFKNWIA